MFSCLRKLVTLAQGDALKSMGRNYTKGLGFFHILSIKSKTGFVKNVVTKAIITKIEKILRGRPSF